MSLELDVAMSEASDEDVLRALYEAADELSRLQRETGEAVLRLDRIATTIGARYLADAATRIDAAEREELTTLHQPRLSPVIDSTDLQELQRILLAAAADLEI